MPPVDLRNERERNGIAIIGQGVVQGGKQVWLCQCRPDQSRSRCRSPRLGGVVVQQGLRLRWSSGGDDGPPGNGQQIEIAWEQSRRQLGGYRLVVLNFLRPACPRSRPRSWPRWKDRIRLRWTLPAASSCSCSSIRTVTPKASSAPQVPSEDIPVMTISGRPNLNGKVGRRLLGTGRRGIDDRQRRQNGQGAKQCCEGPESGVRPLPWCGGFRNHL